MTPASATEIKTYPASGHIVRADNVARYAACFDSEPTAVPATYAAIYALANAMTQAMTDPELAIDVPHMLHGEQEFTWTGQPCIGDSLTSTTVVASDETRHGRRFITLRTKVQQVDGRPVCEARTLQIVRPATATPLQPARPPAGVLPHLTPATTERLAHEFPAVTVSLTPERVGRYAEVSGDRNPIHLDDDAARAAGLPGRIAHGMLTMGILGTAASRWAGGPQRIRALSCRFAVPVLVGDVLTATGHVTNVDGDLVTVSASVRNQHGHEVLQRCTARFIRDGTAQRLAPATGPGTTG
jgi:acyl dehydratase